MHVASLFLLQPIATGMMHNLKEILRHITPFEEQELEQIVTCFKPITVKRGDMLLREGEICRSFYFINKGCIRTFFISPNGNEKTRYVMPDLHIGTALSSFITQKPSIECIDALDDTELLTISHTDFYRLNEQFVKWRIFYQKILEMAYCFQNNKIENRTTLSAKQRYEQLLLDNPLLTQRVSNRILASYLDITQETLSRLRSK